MNQALNHTGNIMKELNFNLKGQRKYIQGPDIYNAIANFYENMKLYELSFHQMMTHNIILCEDMPDKNLYFIAKYKNQIDEKILFGVKNESSVPLKSIPYPEENIISKSKIDFSTQEITLFNTSGFSFMEEIIALNKYLLLNITNNKKGKWYFAKLILNDDFKVFYPLSMRFKTLFNNMLAKSEICINGKIAGAVLFFWQA